MANKIILKRSSDSSASGIPTPTNLEYGELALNYATGNLYFRKSDNTLGTVGGLSQSTAQDLAIQMAIALG
jgi:hypothetical protein